MRSKQRGVTFLGWIVLLMPMAALGYVGIRLTPLYLNYMAVSKAVAALASETPDGSTVNVAAIKTILYRRFDIEGIVVPSVDDFKIARDGDDLMGSIEYEEVVPIAGNVSLLVQFKKQVKLQ